MYPNFIIIGAMKSGTTSLYHYLKAHPQIGMSEIKETNFFIKEKNCRKKVEWYKSQFEGNYKIYGEASPSYTKAHLFGGVPQRIYELVPDVKLIYLVRDPISRIISHYTHLHGEGIEKDRINEALREEKKYNHYVMCSKYHWQIQQYLEFFSRKKILIISSDKLRADRKSTLQEIFEFLDVNNTMNEMMLEKKFGVTAKKTRKGRIGRILLNNFMSRALKKNVTKDFKRWIRSLFLAPLEKPTRIKPVLIERLKETLKPDIDAFRSFTGESFNNWSV